MSTPEDFPIKTHIIDHGEIEGIPWVTAAAPIWGAANGYIKLPLGHPWLDMDTIDIPTGEGWCGITYGSGSWIGFDSLHSGQYWPGSGRPKKAYEQEMDHKTIIEWTKHLAQEAADYASSGTYSI